jgi:hypothetical protein
MEAFALYVISNRILNKNASARKHCGFGWMVVRECLDLWSQYSESRFVPMEVIQETGACLPDDFRAWIERCEDVKQVFDVHVLRCDPSRFSKLGSSGSMSADNRVK